MPHLALSSCVRQGEIGKCVGWGKDGTLLLGMPNWRLIHHIDVRNGAVSEMRGLP
jgi:hypothetical protein